MALCFILAAMIMFKGLLYPMVLIVGGAFTGSLGYNFLRTVSYRPFLFC